MGNGGDLRHQRRWEIYAETYQRFLWTYFGMQPKPQAG